MDPAREAALTGALSLALGALLSPASVIVAAACAALGIWAKGNTHAHTTASDGDSSPEAVAQWYRSHGYDFLTLSDHNALTQVAPGDTAEGLLLIPGEELTADYGGKPIHVNALGVTRVLQACRGTSVTDTIQQNVDVVVNAGGLAQVNHPNWEYAFGDLELLQVERFSLLEVYSGDSDVNTDGDTSRPSVERMWDALLSAGKVVYGVAVDDAHHYTEFAPHRDNPGRGWIMVHVKEISRSEVLANIRKGNFYASTGVELADYSVNSSAIRVSMKPLPGLQYVTKFIGLNGKALREVKGRLAIYRFTGQPAEAYVRAKIIASDGSRAWTQPVRPA